MSDHLFSHRPAQEIRRPSALIDLVDAVAQVHVSTPELIAAMGEVDRAAGANDALSVRVDRKHLNLICRPDFGRRRTTLQKSMPCTGTFGGRILSVAPMELSDLARAPFYERQTALTLCADEGSLYVGKYRISVSISLRVHSRPRTDIDLVLDRIKMIDAENSHSPPPTRTVLAERYERDETLTSLLKRLRGDACQICGSSFRTRAGRSYTECHHLEHLAHGGFDVTKNIIVLCANHHRQFHYGDVAILEHTPERLSVSIDGHAHSCTLTLDPPKA